jgi:hypothetical protein
MQIPGLGSVHHDNRFPDWYRSNPVALPLLNGEEAVVVVSNYDEDPRQEDFEVAIRNLLSCPFEVFRRAEPYIFKYYQEMNSTWWTPEDPEYLVIESPDKVWQHIQVGRQPMVSRRASGDKAIYASFECECDWEPEHGLQIVLRNGHELVKVGPFDGHLTNSDAFADSSLEHVIYR